MRLPHDTYCTQLRRTPSVRVGMARAWGPAALRLPVWLPQCSLHCRAAAAAAADAAAAALSGDTFGRSKCRFSLNKAVGRAPRCCQNLAPSP